MFVAHCFRRYIVVCLIETERSEGDERWIGRVYLRMKARKMVTG